MDVYAPSEGGRISTMIMAGSPRGESSSSSSDSDGSVSVRRYGGLKPKKTHLLLAKAHHGRQFFDSAEWASSLQGVVLQDLLPGGAPMDSRPVKSEPTARVHRGCSPLVVEAPRHLQPGGAPAHFALQLSTCDY